MENYGIPEKVVLYLSYALAEDIPYQRNLPVCK